MKWTLAAAGLALAAAGLFHAVLEPLAAWAEQERGAYLWRTEEWLALFTPANYVDKGDGRLLLTGPSEAREAFLIDPFDFANPDLAAYQASQSMGTLEDSMVALEYLDRVYGESALPDVLLAGFSTRYVSNIRSTRSPLFQAIDLYSPAVEMDPEADPPGLRPRGFIDGLRARVRYRLRQQHRYQVALKVVAWEMLHASGSSLAAHPRVRDVFSPAKYHGQRPWPDETKRGWLGEDDGLPARVQRWDAAAARERVESDLHRLVDFTSGHGIGLYVVNMPEWSELRAGYPPGRYEAYLEIVRAGLGDTPFLDLREALQDEQFFDPFHPTLDGCRAISERVAQWVAEQRRKRPEEQR